ncbi:MAG: hypothetical protein ACHQ0J_10435 [Candidatus Dormibacterales bacterium]
MRRYVNLLTLVILAFGTVTAASCDRSTTPNPKPPSVLVVFTTWVPDANVANGPEPGYKPALSGLSGRDILTATPAIDASGTSWVVDFTFTHRGADLFATLTRDNVAACPGDSATSAAASCPQRHLSVWLDLTQADIDQWEDPAFVDTVSQPYELGCLTAPSTAPSCAKFVSDPLTLQEIDGGQVQIFAGVTQQGAGALAVAISALMRS